MRYLSLFMFMLFVIPNLSAQDNNYKIDENESVYFEEILDFKGISRAELHKRLIKVLKISDYSLLYFDENEIYAVGKFEVRLRKHALVFFKTDEYNCLYDLKINIKDGKIKFKATNFFLIPLQIKISSFGLGGHNYSSGMSSFWSTTKIPLDVPKISLDQYHRKKMNKDKNLLFDDVEINISSFQETIIKILNEDEDDW
ncbi:DUF4468 domain-containing protein [Lacinutrix himadriensis]|uniref:DUF4468 domain-containing protein n=1 Tax=Lacinutrix himadriensis TaxID=641549 RepID=UPI0006E195C1|nr:DUF4468 domain-containing protein [Lacinutrix himadriensis]